MDDERILAVIEAKREAALATHRFVHEHPELSHEERDCSRYLCDVLEGAGLEVERGVAGMDTAFRATLRGSRPGRSVGLVCPLRRRSRLPSGRDDRAGALLRTRRDPGGRDRHRPRIRRSAGGALRVTRRLRLPRRRDSCSADSRARRRQSGLRGSRPLGRRSTLRSTPTPSSRTRSSSAHAGCDAIGRWSRERGRSRMSRNPRSRRCSTAIAAVKSLPPGDAIVEHIALDGDVEEGGGLVVRIHFLLRADEEAGLDQLAAPLRAALPEAVWSSDPVVCGLRSDAEITQAVKEAVLALGGEFVDDPGAASVRHRLRQRLTEGPVGAHRHRPPWAAGRSTRTKAPRNSRRTARSARCRSRGSWVSRPCDSLNGCRGDPTGRGTASAG